MDMKTLQAMSENELYGLADAFGIDYVGDRLSLDEICALLVRRIEE